MNLRGVAVVVLLLCLGALLLTGNVSATPPGEETPSGTLADAGSVSSPPTAPVWATNETDTPRGAEQNASNGTICVVLFYAPGCPHCHEVIAYLDEASERYDLRVRAYRAAESPGQFQQYADRYGVPADRRGYVPTMFVGDQYCVGSDQCIALLSETLPEREAAGLACPAGGSGSSAAENVDPTRTGTSDGNSVVGGVASGESNAVERRAVTLAGLGGLALVDAINPCALAVLLLLLTVVLSEHPDRPRRALASGLLFSAAVFLAYYGIGTLIVLGFRSAASLAGLSATGLYPLLGAVAILLGLLNLKDWLWHGAGGFVFEVPISWRPRMRRHIVRVASPMGAFAVGFVVSLFLLPCTSGPYVVAGGLLAEMPWPTALAYLGVYNCVFVLPMVAITLAVYGGFVSVERLAGWRERNVERLHLVAGLVLLTLGAYLLVGV
jgi:glutaredoxin